MLGEGGEVHPLPLLDETLSTKSKNELLITVMLFMIVHILKGPKRKKKHFFL